MASLIPLLAQLAYVVLLLVPVELARRALRRRPRVGFAVLAVLGIGACAGALAFVGFFAVASTRWGGSLFLVLGLFAWGVFLHVPLALLLFARELRTAHPRAAGVAVTTALVVVGVYVFAFWIEPRRLEVTRHVVESERVTRPHRLVLVADVQTDDVGAFERRALEAALAEDPDVLLFAGDYVHVLSPDAYWDELEELGALFRELELDRGRDVVAVEGNCERDGWPRVFAGLDVHALVETSTVTLGELSVTGLSFSDGFDAGLVLERPPGFHVVLSHGPDFALGAVEADLLLAGHTHGGQVRLPWLGPPITLSRVPRAWAAGRTELISGATLYVSRGVGMERGHAPRLRFLCRPEVVVIDVVPVSVD